MKIESISRHIQDNTDLLQEINVLLGNSLNLSDSFRVVGREIFNIIPFQTNVLYTMQPESFNLTPACASGANSDLFIKYRIDRRKITTRFDAYSLEKVISLDLKTVNSPFLPVKLSSQYKSVLIMPLKDRTINFGLMAFYESQERPFDNNAISQMEVLRPLISELMLKAHNTEKTRQASAPSPVIELPKGFFVALQSHIEEFSHSESYGGLTVFHIEIRDFAEVINSHGDSSAEFLISEVSRAIRNQLRRLDIVSKISRDEILVSLPMVSALERNSIAERIKSSLEKKVFYLPNNTVVTPELLIGSASLGFEGETAAELLYMASLDTRQQKVLLNNPQNLQMMQRMSAINPDGH